MHDFLTKPKRKHIKEIPLAPILDLLVVVIFFLILSASFVELRQNIIPPSSSSIISSAVMDSDSIPLNPKLLIMGSKGNISLLLKWQGSTPGQILKKIKISQTNYDLELKTSTHEIVKEFKKNYPDQNQIQLGWHGDMIYQSVLTTVDGVVLEIKDLVLLSPEDSEILFKKSLDEV